MLLSTLFEKIHQLKLNISIFLYYSCSTIVLPLIKPKLSPNNIQLLQQDVCPTCRCDYQR